MKVEFYHGFDIPSCGIKTRGQWNHGVFESLFRKHIRVQDKSVLDVACRDGWYSLLFESMGASSVTAMDIDDRKARQYVFGKVGTRVKFQHRNVYTLANNPAPVKAQVVFTGDLLCHLYHPVLALQGMHNACEEVCYMACDVSSKTEVGNSGYPGKWTKEDLRRLLRIAQFERVEELASFSLTGDYWKQKGGYFKRNLVLLRCERNPDFVLPEPLDGLIYGSPNKIPELTVEVPME